MKRGAAINRRGAESRILRRKKQNSKISCNTKPPTIRDQISKSPASCRRCSSTHDFFNNPISLYNSFDPFNYLKLSTSKQ